jgi:hypothetical protein
MQLIPGVLGVIDPCTGQADAVADVRLRQVAPVARHELDDQVSMLLECVRRGQEVSVGRIQRDVDMKVAIWLVSHDGHTANRVLTGAEDPEPTRVIDTTQHPPG